MFDQLRKRRSRGADRSKYGPMRSVVLTYLISRLEGMASPEDPAIDLIPVVAKALGLELDVRTARDQMYQDIGPNLARVVEELLTGEIWVDDGSRVRG